MQQKEAFMLSKGEDKISKLKGKESVSEKEMEKDEEEGEIKDIDNVDGYISKSDLMSYLGLFCCFVFVLK
jgi:hypothetical protein